MSPKVKLPERIANRLMKLQSEIDEILERAQQLLTTILPGPIQFQFKNSTSGDVLTPNERAQVVSFVTRFQHLPGDCGPQR
jgi:hypothetical protein